MTVVLIVCDEPGWQFETSVENRLNAKDAATSVWGRIERGDPLKVRQCPLSNVVIPGFHSADRGRHVCFSPARVLFVVAL